MGNKKSKKPKRPVFDSIRKPTAPNSQKFGNARPEEKIHPTGRKAKHKDRIKKVTQDDDV